MPTSLKAISATALIGFGLSLSSPAHAGWCRWGPGRSHWTRSGRRWVGSVRASACITPNLGVADARGYIGMGIAWFDSNDDGWPDLYVANDSGPN